MSIEYRNGPMKYAELWFDDPVDSVDVDVVICHQRTVPLKGASCQPFSTRTIDLTASEEEIFHGLSKDARWNIRKAEKNDQMEYQLWMPGEWDQDVLRQFKEFQHNFARSKHLSGVNDRYLSGWARSGCIALSRVKLENIDLVWDSTVISSGVARWLHGATCPRSDSDGLSQLIGQANRYRIWSNIRAFKRRGCNVYDLGGWYVGTEDLEKVRINQFKKEFGGQIMTQYDCVRALTPKGRLYLVLKGLQNRFRERKPKEGAAT
jgi:hypothetical protein